MQFRWSKNGVDIASSNRIQIIPLPQISTLVIDPVNEEDSGNYTCTVFSRGISDSYTASLIVLSKYTIVNYLITIIAIMNLETMKLKLL